MSYENGGDRSKTPDVQEGPGAEAAIPPLNEAPLPGRRVLHIALLVVLVVPAVVWLTPTSSDTQPDGRGVEIEAAPDFTLDLLDGGSFTLSEHLRRNRTPVVMNFWASWCVPCREEMPALDKTARSHRELLVLGVAVEDTEAAAQEFAAEVGVSYPLALDRDGTMVDLYPTLGLPTTWFITSDGTITARWIGQLDEARLHSLIEQHLTG